MRRFTLLGGLLYGLILLGLVIMKGEVLVLAIPPIIYLGAALLWSPPRLQLRVSRDLSASRAFEGNHVAVSLSVTNEGERLEDVLVADVVPPGLELVDGEPETLTSLVAGETVELTYTVKGRRGLFPFQDVQVTASDHLSLIQRRVTLEAAPAELLVMPEVTRLRRVTIRPLRTRATAGPVPARQGGSGVEFFGVREYQPSDPLRWINWRASARHPRVLFTNEFERERIADVGLILDARQRSDVASNGESLFESAIRATASLAEAFLQDGNRVGLLVYGGFLSWTFPGYGRVQRVQILDALARAETGESMVFDSLDYLPTRLFPAKSQLVVISPLCLDDWGYLVRLRARGYQLLVISPDPVTFEAGSSRSDPTWELAARIARLERTLLLRRLRQAGIQVVDWQVDKPFDQVVHGAIGRVPHWFRAVGVAL
jgi:uncharacterized protein (DUF58 family)